jgi:putative transposase
VSRAGTFIVTAGTYHKLPRFQSPKALSDLTNLLLDLAEAYQWKLQALAIFPNHYHFIVETQQPDGLKNFVRELHSRSAAEINREEDTPGRQIWFQYWESHITFHRSYLARLNYVHQNAVRHGVVSLASEYPWCSAGWFERSAERAFFQTVKSFPIDRLVIPDDFAVEIRP